jgi:hypothetical protein
MRALRRATQVEEFGRFEIQFLNHAIRRRTEMVQLFSHILFHQHKLHEEDKERK